MTVFHLDSSSSVRSSPEKHKYSIEELQMLLTDYRQWKVESRSSVSSESDAVFAEDSDDTEKADDIWDEEMLGDPKLGTGLLHDHCYTKRKTEKRVPSVSSECSNEADESLQHLFDTCDIDRDFLAEATLAHSHFLEDVLDIDDVPADDFLFFDFDENSAGSLMPAQESSSCLTIAPSLSSVSTSSCIFTSAGSTDTVLTTRVAGLTSYNTHRSLSSPPSPHTSCCVSAGSMSASVSVESPRVQVPLFDFSSASLPSSSSSSASSTLTSFSSDFPSHSSFKSDLATDCSGSASLDSKLKDVIDFLFSPAAAPRPAMSTSPNVTSFLEEMDSARCAAATKSVRQPPLSFSDSDDSVWPVTLSHRIQNGACVSCCLRRRQSATSSNSGGLIRASDESFPSTSNINNNVDTVLTCPTPPMSDAAATTTHLQQSSQQQQRDGDSSSTPSPSRNGKRKSCDTDTEECSLYPPVCGKQPRLGAAASSDEETDRDEVFSPPSFPALSPVQSHLPAAPDADNAEWCDLDADKLLLASSEEAEGLKKQSREVFDFLSAFSGSNTKLPLSPINVNHFGRCG